MRTVTTMKPILAALLLLAAVAPATAGNNELSTGSFTRALRSSSANALTEDSLGGGGFAYARVLPLDVLPGVEVWGTGAMSFGTATGQMFQTLDTEIDTMHYTAGARARYPVFRWLVANARLDLGLQRAAVSLRDSAGHSASDTGWGAISTGALGLELLAVSHPRFSLGLRFELGYFADTDIGLTAKSDEPDEDTLELERMEASLGHLDLGGRFFAFTVISQF